MRLVRKLAMTDRVSVGAGSLPAGSVCAFAFDEGAHADGRVTKILCRNAVCDRRSGLTKRPPAAAAWFRTAADVRVLSALILGSINGNVNTADRF